MQQTTNQKTRRKTWGLTPWALLLVAAWGTLGATQRASAYTASKPNATTATVTTAAGTDTLTITRSGTLLQVNGSTDFDTGVAGTQTLTASAATTLTISLSSVGAHTVVLGTPASPASTLLANIVISGNNSTSTLTVDDSGSNTANAITSDTAVSGLIHGTGINVGDDITFSGGVFITTGTATNTVNIQSSAVGEPTTLNSSGPANVTIGNAGSVQNMGAPVTVTNTTFYTNLTVDDSTDAGTRTATISATAITGLAPATINYVPSKINAFTVNGGTGGNTFTVANTISGSINILNSGGGNDTVNVLTTTIASTLNVNGQAGNDTVMVGNAGSAQAIAGTVNVTDSNGLSNLTVDDSADTTARTVSLNDTTLTGLAPVSINYVADDMNALTVYGGSGGNTFTIPTTPAQVITTLNSGVGNNTINVLATSALSTLGIYGHTGVDTVTIGNAGSTQAISGVVYVSNNGGLTNLTVDDSADTTKRTTILSSAGIIGLAPGTINPSFGVGNLTVNGGSGGNNFTVTNTIPLAATTLNSGTGLDTVNVLATAATSTLKVNGQNGNDNVTVGNAGSAQGISGVVTITNISSYTNLTVDDSADATPRTATLSQSAITGLSPAPINYQANYVSSFTVSGGTGGNTFTVNSTPGNQPSTLNSGAGNDTVNVLTTNPSSSLGINNGGGNDLVTLGSAGNAQGIVGGVAVANYGGTTSLTVDDSADTVARTVTVSGTQVMGAPVTGLTPGTIVSFGVAALALKTGTANDTFNVTPSINQPLITPNQSLNLDGGAGSDTLNFNLSGVTGTQFTNTGVGAGKVTFSNCQPVTYANFEIVTPANQPPFNTTPSVALSTGENTPLTLSVANSDAISVGDPDAGTNPISVTLSVTGGTLSLNPAALGSLTFSTGNGTNNASMVFTGTIANINAALNGLVFTPTNLFSGSALLSIVTNDLGNTGSGGALSASTTVPITVLRAPRSLSIVSSVAQLEGNSGITNMPFTVTLTPVSGLPVTVGYATADGTATAGSDYAATSGTLTFLAGQTTQTINVPILGDTVHEADETFTVTLGSATNATVAAANAVSTGTILNDDAVPGLSINDVALPLAATGSTPFPFTVTLSAASGLPVTANYTTAPGTATAGEDYTTTSGTLTFAPGVTSQTINVPVLSEPVSEAPATFTVNLSGAVGATLTRATGTGTITNPTASALSLTVTPSSFKQNVGESAAVGTIARNTDDTSTPLVVTLSSSNPLRAAPAIKTVTIPVGAASAKFVIDAIADTLAGNPPTVTITATAPGLASATATLTVTNTNRPALGLAVKPTRVLETAGATATVGTVTRNTPTTAALKVTLTSSNIAKATVPAFVTIPAKAVSVNFPIRVLHKTTPDGPQRVTITSKATGLDAATAAFTVLDSESHLTAGGRITTTIAADAGTTGLNGTTNLTGAGGTPSKPVLVGVPNAVATLFTGSTVRDVVTTDKGGAYSFTNLPAGSYTIKVAQPGYTFAPAARPVTLTTANATGLDFTGTAKTSLTGRVINRLADGSRAPLVGITITARSGHGLFTARTDAKGHYSFAGLALDAYLLLPAVKGTFFTPASQTVLLNAANPTVSAMDFVQAGTDKIAPTVKVTGPLKGAYSAANQPTKVTGSAQDTGGAGVAYVTVALLRYNSATATTPTAFLNFNTGAFGAASALTEKLAAGTAAWTLRSLPTLPAGFYGVRAMATDGAGNVGTSAIVRYSVTAPVTPPAHAVAAPVSSLGLSTATANVASNSVALHFLGALDADTASDAANYTITVKGQSVTVESAGYNANNHTVTLGLPEGTLHSGDAITISWTGLQDSAGHVVAGSAVVK